MVQKKPRPIISYRRGALRPGDAERIVKLRKVPKTIEQICNAGGYLRGTVVRVLKAAKLETRDAPAPTRPAKPKRIRPSRAAANLVQVDGVTPNQVSRIVFQRKSKWSLRRICANLGLNRGIVRAALAANGMPTHDTARPPRVKIADRLAADPKVIAYLAECRKADVDDRVMARHLEVKSYVIQMLRDRVGWERLPPGKLTEAEQNAQNDRIRALAEDEGLDAGQISAALGLKVRTVEVAMKSMGLDGWPEVQPEAFDQGLRAAAAKGGVFRDHPRALPTLPDLVLPAFIPVDREYRTSQSSIA